MSYKILRGRWCNIFVLNVHAPCEDKSDDVKDSFYEELARVFDQFPRYDMNILLGDFNAKVGREDIFKPTVGNKSPHETSNDDGVRAVSFATSKNVFVKSNLFPYRSIQKYIWTSPDGQKHNKIDHVLIGRRRHSSILNVRYFRRAYCDTDHYMLVAKIRERLELSKRPVNKMDMDRFNLKM
jgi:endonuclease/exonuclease/phosphatase family metal-dependent hydrolase